MKKHAFDLLFLIIVLLSTDLYSQNRPNILFVVADDMSHASCYGDEFLSTPNFDKIAELGLRFTHMYTPSSKCAPSRAVMITGRNPWQLEAAANHQPIWPEKFKSVVEVLSDHGYFAGFTGKGWNPGIHPEGRNLTGKEYNKLKRVNMPTTKVAKYDYSANFNMFLQDKPSDQPFFFWYGCKEPHRGYEFKSGERYGKSLDSLNFTPSFWDDDELVKHDILDYAVEVEYFDLHLGEIIQYLKDAGEFENTLIIATSDNGMPFPRYKGHPHEFATRLPFVVSWPRQIKNPGRTCYEYASFIDIAPTFLEVGEVSFEDSGMQDIQGKSLCDFFNDKVKGRNQVLTGRERNDMCRPNGWGYPVRSLHKGDFVYMHNFAPDRWPCGTEESGFRDTDWSPTKAHIMYKMEETPSYEYCFGKRPQEELYNVKSDPECLSNLALNPEYNSLKKKMKKVLFKELATQGDPRMSGNGDMFNYARPSRLEVYYETVEKYKRNQSKNKK